MTTADEVQEPKRRKRHRIKIKKLNPFRKKYKKFAEDDVTHVKEADDDIKKFKKRSRARQFLHSAVGVITFRSLRKRRRRRANSAPLSSGMRRRTKYSSTGSLDFLVTFDIDELPEKGLKRSQSDSCLYQTSIGLKKKKKSKTKRVKKASVRAAKLMGAGMVQAAGVFQYMSPMAGIPSAISQASHPTTPSRPKASYYDNQRKRHQNYSNIHYAFSS